MKPQVFNVLKQVINKKRLYLCNETSNVCEDLPSRRLEQIMLPLVKTEKNEQDHEEPA